MAVRLRGRLRATLSAVGPLVPMPADLTVLVVERVAGPTSVAERAAAHVFFQATPSGGRLWLLLGQVVGGQGQSPERLAATLVTVVSVLADQPLVGLNRLFLVPGADAAMPVVVASPPEASAGPVAATVLALEQELAATVEQLPRLPRSAPRDESNGHRAAGSAGADGETAA